jgi:hypothetical protein
MKINYKNILYSVPRVLSIVMTIFFYLFIVEVFLQGFKFTTFLYALLPGTISLIITLVAFKKNFLGGLLFTGIGLLYLIAGLMNKSIAASSVLLITIPLLITGALFILNHYYIKEKPISTFNFRISHLKMLKRNNKNKF